MDPQEQLFRAKAKRLLRQRARGMRSSIPKSGVARRSAQICERLLQLDAFNDATSVALFWPIIERNEVDLRALDSALRERGCSIAYPAIDPDSHAMTFRRVDDVALLADRGMRFHEPSPDAPTAAELEVIVVPGLMFDALGHRIGYGGGYYDRALAQHPETLSIGVAFQFQLGSDLPSLEHDVAVRVVVTDERSIHVAAG